MLLPKPWLTTACWKACLLCKNLACYRYSTMLAYENFVAGSE